MTKNRVTEELTCMSLGDHLEELRTRLILGLAGVAIALIFSLALGGWFVKLLMLPYEFAASRAGIEYNMQAFRTMEKFTIYLKASIILAVIIASPWIIYQIWLFVSSGLYKHERKFVHVVTPISVGLFIIGVVFFLFVVAPLVLSFAINFKLPGLDYIDYKPQITDYVNVILTLTLVFGIAFQSPIAIVFAERMGLVSIENLVKSRKFVLLGVFIIAAAATPPDVVSQIMLGIPLYILYEGSILFCRLWHIQREEKLDTKDAES